MRKKTNGVEFEGRKYTWCRCLTMVAHSLGLPGGKWKAVDLARKVAKQHGWEFTGSKDIIRRRTLELLTQGVRPKPLAKFVPYVGQSSTRRPIGEPHPDYRKDDGFYLTRAWRELRLEVLRNMRNCQACGRGPAQGTILHVDHIQPRYKAPHLSLVLDNLQVLCEDCNLGKGAWDDTDFRHFRSI